VTAAHGPRREAQEHLSDEDAAEYAESPQQAPADAADHLEVCATCRERVASIAEVLALLEDLPVVPIPLEVDRRVEAAIGREYLLAAELQASVPARPARSRRRIFAAAGWLAGAAVLCGGVVGVISVSGRTGSSSATAAGSGVQPPVALTSVTGHPLLRPGATGLADNAPVSKAAGYQSLTAWVQAVVPALGTSLAAPDEPSGQASQCLSDPAFAGRQLIATSTSDYDGEAALLAVYADGDDTSAVYGVVFAMPCTAYSVLSQGVVPVG
jgi:hypothetical protein